MALKREVLGIEEEKRAEIENKMYREQLFRSVAAGLTKFEKVPVSSAGVRKSVPGRRNCIHISLESGKNLASVLFTKETSGTKV